MNNIDDVIYSVNYYYEQYRQQARLKTAVAVLNSERDLSFVSKTQNQSLPPINQLEFITAKFQEISETMLSEKGIKKIVKKLSKSDYDALTEKLRYIQQRSVDIARSESGWISSIVGFGLDMISTSLNPISRAEAQMHEVLQNVDKSYKTVSALGLPRKLEELQEKLHLAAFKCTLELKNTQQEFLEGTQTLNELIGTVEESLPFLMALKTSLDEAKKKVNTFTAETANAATRFEILKKSSDLSQTIKAIETAVNHSYDELTEEIENLFFFSGIETPLLNAIPFERLNIDMQTKFHKLLTILNETTALANEKSPMLITKFIVNTSQIVQVLANLERLEKQIDSLGNPSDRYQLREEFISKIVLTKAKEFLKDLEQSPAWNGVLNGSPFQFPLSFYTEYWMLKEVSLLSMSDVNKLTETLNTYRSGLREVSTSARSLLKAFVKTQPKEKVTTTEKISIHSLARADFRNQRKPMKKAH